MRTTASGSAEALHERGGCRDLEVRLRRKSGEVFWASFPLPYGDFDGESCVISYLRDVSEAKADEEKDSNLAFYDTLTGLPNRRLLWERLRQALISSIRSGSKHALLIRRSRWIQIAERHAGHHIGDLMLQETARRIANCVREVDTVARLGGDEFVIILEDLSQIAEIAAAQARTVGGKILAAIDQPFLLEAASAIRRPAWASRSLAIKREHQRGASTGRYCDVPGQGCRTKCDVLLRARSTGIRRCAGRP